MKWYDVHCKRPGLFQQSLVNPVAVRKHAFQVTEGWLYCPDSLEYEQCNQKIKTMMLTQPFPPGLGLRYSFMGPFETMHLNVNGVEDYCKTYGANILNIGESQSASRSLSGSTLDAIKKH